MSPSYQNHEQSLPLLTDWQTLSMPKTYAVTVQCQGVGLPNCRYFIAQKILGWKLKFKNEMAARTCMGSSLIKCKLLFQIMSQKVKWWTGIWLIYL